MKPRINIERMYITHTKKSIHPSIHHPSIHLLLYKQRGKVEFSSYFKYNLLQYFQFTFVAFKLRLIFGFKS